MENIIYSYRYVYCISNINLNHKKSKKGDKMKRFIKKIIGIAILAGIEVFSYFKIKPTNLEMFFFVWSFISLLLLLYNIFNASLHRTGVGGHAAASYVNFAGSSVAEKKDSNVSKKRSGGGLYDPINWVYSFLLIGNIIGYITFMPR